MAIGFFDGNKADASPESIKRKRAMIAQMMASSRAPRNIGEGLNSIGDSIASSILGYQADKAERANEAERARIMGGINFGGSPMASAGNPVATGSGATRMSRGGPVDPAIRDGIATTASSLGIDPVDLATAISYETGGTFDPTKRGPTTQWGQHKGLIQFGQPQAKQHGVDWNNPVGSQLGPNGAVASYLRSTGVRPGMGLLDIYSAINAGGVGRYNRSDANNGGAPGTVRDKVEQQMAGHRARAMAMFQPPARPVQTASAGPQSNDAQMQDGAGELQAGGSGLMAEPAVYRGQLNDVPSGDLMQRGPMPALPPGFDLSSLVMPAGQPSGAMGQGIADNEEQTRMMEAQMAAEQGLPYAGNEPGAFNQSDVFSPVPMGLGPNPFLPREPDAMAQAPAPMRPQMDRATFDAITGQQAPAPSMDRATFDQVIAGLPPRAPAFTGQQAGLAPSWAGDAEALAPGAREASGPAPGPFPTPPRRPANLGPQSPLVPQAMRQPIAPMEAGENGGGAMQFIESEFARREGRPDPRSAIGAPPAQIYNAFVPQAPQMAGGGGSVQGVSQGDTVAGSAAQAQARPQGGMITPDQLRTVMMSRIPDADKRFVLDMYNQQQARAQAEADRARVQAQNNDTADALKIDRRLGGVAPAVSAAAAAQLGNKTENIPATVAAREAEGRRLGLQGPALQQFALTGQLPNAAISENKIAAETKAREAEADRIGLKRGDPRYQNFVLTGKMPREDTQPLTATDKKAIMEADDGVMAAQSAITSLQRAKALSAEAYQGPLAAQRGYATSILGDKAGSATVQLNNEVTTNALTQLKSIFGAAPTEGERKILLEIQGSASLAHADRVKIYDRAEALAQRRLEFAKRQADGIRGGDYYKPEAQRGQGQPAQTNTPAQASAALQNARKAIADGAPRQAVIDRLRQAGIDPGGL